MLKKHPVSARAWPAVGHPGEGAHTTNHGPVQGKMEGNYGKSGIRYWESDGGKRTQVVGDFRGSFLEEVASELDLHEMGLGVGFQTEEIRKTMN